MSDRVNHWQRPITAAEWTPKHADYVPSGYTRIDATVWIGLKDVVITGQPEESDDEETGHNCDAIGCGWDHVLYRIPLSDWKRGYPLREDVVDTKGIEPLTDRV